MTMRERGLARHGDTSRAERPIAKFLHWAKSLERDDAVIVPFGLWLAVRLIPPEVLAELRQRAGREPLPKSRVAATVVIGLWLAGLLGATLLAIRLAHG